MRARPQRPAEALRWQVISLVLDPTDPTGENNTMAAVMNWGKAHGDAGRYEEALKVYAFGRSALGAPGVASRCSLAF